MAILQTMPPPRGFGGGGGGWTKNASLLTLTFQNSAFILIMHYSRIMPQTGDHRYFTSTAVFLNELIKLAVSLSLALYETSRTLAPSTPATVLFEQVYRAVFASGDCWKLAIPAVFYTLQQLLQYVAIGNLDAVQFQVLYQLKILTTAIFSVVLLRRTLGAKRWMALLVLTLGVCIVSLPADSGVPVSLYLPDATENFFPRSLHELGQASPELYQPQSPHLAPRTPYEGDLPVTEWDEQVEREAVVEREVEEEDGNLQPRQMAKRSIPDDTIEVKRTEEEDQKRTNEPAPAQPRRLTTRSATYEGITEDLGPPEEQMNYSVGVTAVLIAAGFSGLGGVSFEKLLKESPSHASLWIRNIQLSIYSLITAFFGGVLYQDGQGIREHGFFEGYNWVVWVLVVLQSCGGLVASLVIRDADNIVKNFATSISIVISFTASMVIFDFTVTWPFVLGTSLVLFSTYLYSLPNHLPHGRRPPPLRIASFEKAAIAPIMTPRAGMTPKLAIAGEAGEEPEKLNLDGGGVGLGSGGAGGGGSMKAAGRRGDLLAAEWGLTSSRPTSPMLPRTASKSNFHRDD